MKTPTKWWLLWLKRWWWSQRWWWRWWWMTKWWMNDKCLMDRWLMMVMDDNWRWLRMTDDDWWWMIRRPIMKYLTYGRTNDDGAWSLMTDDWRLTTDEDDEWGWWWWHVYLLMHCGCNHIILKMRQSSHPNTAPADSRNARAAGHPKAGIKEAAWWFPAPSKSIECSYKSHRIDEAFLMRICGEIRRRHHRIQSSGTYKNPGSWE